MIAARDEKTRKFLERLRKQQQRDQDMRRRAKKDREPMRLAVILYHQDGSITRIWSVD